VAQLHALIATTPFVAATSLAYDERPPSAGFIKGTIRFVDGSQLDFKEFLITQPTWQVIKYGYHYRMGDRLIFCYDNARDPAARSLPTFPHHKHVPAGLLAAEPPSFEQVLQEIVSQLKIP
jgi:hypothetical protein